MKTKHIHHWRISCLLRPLNVALLALVLLACCRSALGDPAVTGHEDFWARYSQSLRDYCSTNAVTAEKKTLAFRNWILDPKHAPESAVMRRDILLFSVNGRLFLLEEHLGKSEQANKFCSESMEAWNQYIAFLESEHLPHGLKRVTSKEELRDVLASYYHGLDVGWMKDERNR